MILKMLNTIKFMLFLVNYTIYVKETTYVKYEKYNVQINNKTR